MSADPVEIARLSSALDRAAIRARVAPLTVRVSPAEREALRGKAERAGILLSEAARAAFDARDPAERQPPACRENAEIAGGE